jgi:hypothetical protein
MTWHFPKQGIDGSWHAVYTNHTGELVSVDQFLEQKDAREFCRSKNTEGTALHVIKEVTRRQFFGETV